MGQIVRFAAAAALVVPFAGPAFADARLAVPCANGVPCSMQVSGHIDAIGSARLPWTASVVVPAGVCLYVFRQSSDGPMLVTMVTPDGKIAKSFNDDAVVNPTIDGWYTIEVDSPKPVGEQLFVISISLNARSACDSHPPRISSAGEE